MSIGFLKKMQTNKAISLKNVSYVFLYLNFIYLFFNLQQSKVVDYTFQNTMVNIFNNLHGI